MNEHVSNYVNLTANIFKYSLWNLVNNTVSVCMHVCFYVCMYVCKKKEKKTRKRESLVLKKQSSN